MKNLSTPVKARWKLRLRNTTFSVDGVEYGAAHGGMNDITRFEKAWMNSADGDAFLERASDSWQAATSVVRESATSDGTAQLAMA